ncbi:MAG TPA: rhomboid family intramembrane serine protease [Candidatus Rikenella faecigallinarum]|uniref:Rhomboid family intramembrane serine protease n=1 Tax=Candidatus Rikenella faecigallinarum TaxID=2838745 RepID=A0A9D1QCQ1_9BACT|nr:rhomboid family intramembrane serine protease [Candidatus Rikenella faecigallinarum]
MSNNQFSFNASGGFSRGQSVVMNLIILNAIIFLAQTLLPQGVGGERMTDLFGLHFWKGADFRWWQPLTYMFLHGGFSHLFFNMFALWMFGRILEYDMGSRRFLTYYLICGVGAGLCNLGVNWFEYQHFLSMGYPPQVVNQQWANHVVTIGASGAVFGVLLAFGMFHPNDRIMLLIPPIPMKAKWFVVAYGVIELFLGVTQTGSNIAHFAHVGGMLFGFVLLLLWKRSGKIYY